MAWNASNSLTSSDTAVLATLLNNLANDDRTWGGNVNGGANTLSNLATLLINAGGGLGLGVSSVGAVFSGVFQIPAAILAQSDTTASAATNSKGPLVLLNPDTTTSNMASILFASKGTNGNTYGNAQITAVFGARAAGYHSTDLVLSTGTNAGPAERVRITSNGNLDFFAIGSYGGGQGIIAIANAAAAPSSNPTGGGILFAQAGALKWRGSSGTVTTIAPA